MNTKVIVALLIGMAVGAASASVIYEKPAPLAVAKPAAGTEWTADHAAIPAPSFPETSLPSPTF